MTIHPESGPGGGKYTIRVRYHVSWKGTLLGTYDGEGAMSDAVAKFVRNPGSVIQSEVYKIKGPFEDEEIVYRRNIDMNEPLVQALS